MEKEHLENKDYSESDRLRDELFNLGYKVIFNCQNNELKENSILLSFDESQTENNEEKFVEMLYNVICIMIT